MCMCICLQASQTQSPLLLDPEVADLSFWEPPGAPLVCESFPFQKDAAAFADWCNAAGPARVASLQAACRQCNFRNFGERWSFMQAQMATLLPGAMPPADQQEQQLQPPPLGEPGPVGEETAVGDAAAAVAAGMVGLEEEGAGVGSRAAAPTAGPKEADGRNPAASMRPPLPRPPPQPAATTAAAGTAGGEAGGGAGPWMRVFTEEYPGRAGYTRRFLAASYKVRGAAV